MIVIQVYFDGSNLGRELVCIFVDLLFPVYFPHIRLCILFSVSGNIQIGSIELLFTLATDR